MFLWRRMIYDSVSLTEELLFQTRSGGEARGSERDGRHPHSKAALQPGCELPLSD